VAGSMNATKLIQLRNFHRCMLHHTATCASPNPFQAAGDTPHACHSHKTGVLLILNSSHPVDA
jgi:hypothetical protein